MLASDSSATGIKIISVFSLQWRTWCTVQILRSFCSSLECQSTNPKIGDCSLRAPSDHWYMFCYTTATSLPPYPSLTWLNWRRSMKRWSMCWRKLVMVSISGLVVLTWTWWIFCWNNSLASPSTQVFCACMWDSRKRAQHYTKKYWYLREEFVPCKERNVINDLLVDRARILFPPPPIKLSLIKQFAKALDKNDDCFTFTGLTMENLKADIFDGPQIRQLIRDTEFENSMNEVELEAWKLFVWVVKNFLGNNKAGNYAELVNNMLTAFRNLVCNMSVKMRYLFSHMVLFPENLASMSDEQGKRFPQDLKEMETRY